MIKIGDYVTRKKYGNDICFIVSKIEGNTVYLKGVDVRLYADTNINDLVLSPIIKKKEKNRKVKEINNSEYLLLLPKILQLDSDKLYLDKCMEYYKDNNIKSYGYLSEESKYKNEILKLISKYNPSIVVITGHDAHFSKEKDGKLYKNSDYFIDTVKEIKSRYKDIVIFAGACQSNYEEIIKAGATFASSPKKINIHALDPAIVASFVALTDTNEIVDIKELIDKTHYGKDAIGGLIVKGRMNKCYPRGEI